MKLSEEELQECIKYFHHLWLKINTISSTEIADKYAPTEEGLVEVTIKKQLSILIVKLTLSPDEADKKAAGYMSPLPETEVVPQKERPCIYEIL